MEITEFEVVGGPGDYEVTIKIRPPKAGEKPSGITFLKAAFDCYLAFGKQVVPLIQSYGYVSPITTEASMHRQIQGALADAYKKHVLGDESIGWNELGDTLQCALCELVGDDAFNEWLEKQKVESEG